MERIRELRRAARSLSRSPGFSLAAVVTIAVGIGATTTVFSLVRGILLQPLPYPAAERLVSVGHAAPGLSGSRLGVSEGTYLHYSAGNRVFDGLATYYESVVNLSGGDAAERVAVALVSGTFFDVLGARVAHGRLPTAADADGSGESVVLLSHALWMRRYGGDPGVVGSRIEANRVRRLVIGVLEPGFDFPDREIGLFYPVEPDPATADATDLYQFGVARLRPGVDAAAAERDLDRLLASLPAAYPDFTPALLAESRLAPVVAPLKEAVVGEARGALWLLLGGMAFLLLIACANVAGLVLVRSEHRQKEVAVRTALGAGRADLAGFFAAEAAILGVAGGALAVLLAAWGVQLLVTSGSVDLPRIHTVRIDGGVGLFAAGLSALAAAMLALIPLPGALRSPRSASLREGAFGMTATRDRQRIRRVLVAGQVALALTLLVGSALIARSLWNLARVDPGFDRRAVLTAEIALPRTGYETYEPTVRLWDAVLERVRALPGVESAGASTALPLVPQPAFHDLAIEVEGRLAELRPALTVAHASPEYFDAMRIPTIEGVGFGRATTEVDRPVLLSAEAARILFAGERPIGRRIRRAEVAGATWMTVAGIVGDVPRERVGGAAAAIVYLPIAAAPSDPGLIPRFGAIAVRASVPPAALAQAVRDIVRDLDPHVPLANTRTMERVFAASTARTTFTMVLLAIAAAAALFLGAVGLYGIVSYAVGRRIREIGIRMALGARGDDVRRMLVREAARIALAGVAIGAIVALGLTRFLRAMLFEVGPADPLSYAAAALLLAGVALLAAHLPARRAVRITPMAALRSD